MKQSCSSWYWWKQQKSQKLGEGDVYHCDATVRVQQFLNIQELKRPFTGSLRTKSWPILVWYKILAAQDVIGAVYCLAMSCWNVQGLPWERLLHESICCPKICGYHSALMAPFQTSKSPVLKAQMHLHTIRYAGFWTEHLRRPVLICRCCFLRIASERLYLSKLLF